MICICTIYDLTVADDTMLNSPKYYFDNGRAKQYSKDLLITYYLGALILDNLIVTYLPVVFVYRQQLIVIYY